MWKPGHLMGNTNPHVAYPAWTTNVCWWGCNIYGMFLQNNSFLIYTQLFWIYACHNLQLKSDSCNLHKQVKNLNLGRGSLQRKMIKQELLKQLIGFICTACGGKNICSFNSRGFFSDQTFFFLGVISQKTWFIIPECRCLKSLSS